MSNKNPGPYELASTYLRLGTDSRIEPLPVDEDFWPNLIAGKLGELKHEYLVTLLSFDADWPSWEQHPRGDEIVYLVSGAVDFILEIDGAPKTIELRKPGSYVIVPIGTWHTAKVVTPATMLFITAGEGTQNRPA